MQVLWEEEREKVRRGLWLWQLYLPRRSAWGNQKWLPTTASVAASRKWRFVKYLFADVAIVCLPLLHLSLSLPSLLLRLRLHDFYLMNFANFLMQHLTHAKDARTVDFCCCCCYWLFCFFFAKFFSPTCLRIHDVQIIVSILKIPSDLCVLFVCAEWFAKGGTCKRLSRWMFRNPALPQALLRERERSVYAKHLIGHS